MYSTPQTHKAVGLGSPTSGLVELAIPTLNPGKDQVLSLSGEVVEVGENVTDLAVGDKVFSCTTYNSGPEGRAFQEYALLDQRLVGKVPSNITLEESSTVPDALLSIFNTYFGAFKFHQPLPTEYPITTPPSDSAAPFLLWGASGGVGQYALQLLRILGYTNVIAVASSKHHELLRSLGATATVDYKAPDACEQIIGACGGPPKYVFDTIGDEEYSLKPILKVVGPQTKLAYFVPIRVGPPGGVSQVMLKPSFEFPKGIEAICIATSYDFEKVPRWEEWRPKTMPVLLQCGLLKPICYREITGSTLLERAGSALDLLRRGEVSGERLTIRVS
ncbi:hypothetical protein K474DRAFT_1770736 [Panus rudis PR-1116 ss-1]|nr:hypothetical protein K474DRAFT_1770736 [Panus rudis PR-1116 ss-1]